MGDAFLIRRGSGGGKEQEITFNNTPMVLTKTMSNALSVGRYNMAVASDEEYIAFVGGLNSSGSAVNNIDFFDRGGKHWTANWPIALSEMAAVITHHRLICVGGRASNNLATNTAKYWFLSDALLNNGSPTAMGNMAYAKCGISVIPFGDMVLEAGGMFREGSGTPNNTTSYVYCHSLRDNSEAWIADFDWGNSYSGFLQCTYKAALAAGGLRLNPREATAPRAYARLLTRNANGSFTVSAMPDLAVAQWRLTQATIYDQGIKYCLFGLGLPAPTAQLMTVVPNIDVYRVASSSSSDVNTTKYSTFTLPLDSNPISAVALGFGDCVLYVVGYMNELTKGYLVQLNPLRITTMEFNFRSSEFQGGVINNDVGFIAGGIKNEAFSTDVEMIQLLRNVPIYPGMKYKVGSMASEETSNILTLHPLNDEIKLSGYMKL